MLLQYVILYLLLSVTSGSEDAVYCSLRYTRLCQEKGQHVGCQYPDPGKGESCENYTKIEFTEEMRNLILHYINKHRQRLAAGHERARGGQPIPKPEIMMYVEWDRELAYLAQRLADQCRFVHDECRATVRYPYAGQTVGEVRWKLTRESDEITAQRAIRKVFDAWWGEKRRVQPQQLTSPFKVTAKGAVWGHFTQLAVWKLRAVGCGAVRHGPSHPRLLLVCDYSHTNMLGQKTLIAGPISTCPPHTARRPHSQYPFLCSTIRYKTPHEIYGIDDYESEVTREIIRTERPKGYLPYEEEEEETTRFRENTRASEIDIYVRKTKTTTQPRRQDSREETYQRVKPTEDEFNKVSEIYVQTRTPMRNVQQYQQEELTSSTTHRHSDFEEERSNDIVPNVRKNNDYETKIDSEEDRRFNMMPKDWKNGHSEEMSEFEERMIKMAANDRDNGHYEQKSNSEDERNNVMSNERKNGNYEKNDFEEQRRNNIVPNYRDNFRYEKKPPHLSNHDYSVIPLNKHQGQAKDVDIPWRPKLYRRTSTTELPEYETSIVRILVPVRRKGHRLSTATAATLPQNVMRNILRTYHDSDTQTRPTTRAREKDLIHPVRRPLAPSLKLDKDDIDQLFRDTGFKPNWTPKK